MEKRKKFALVSSPHKRAFFNRKGVIKIDVLKGDVVVASKISVADTFLKRAKGLLGTTHTRGLLIKPCNQVHCIGMKYNIDVVFLSKNDTVLHIQRNMKPGNMSPIIRGSKKVLELPAGDAEYLRKGDLIIFKEG